MNFYHYHKFFNHSIKKHNIKCLKYLYENKFFNPHYQNSILDFETNPNNLEIVSYLRETIFLGEIKHFIIPLLLEIWNVLNISIKIIAVTTRVCVCFRTYKTKTISDVLNIYMKNLFYLINLDYTQHK